MAKNINMIVGERLENMELPKDVRDIINCTEFRLMAEVFGDFYQPESLVDFVRTYWDIDSEDYTWWELNEWKY